VSTIAIADGRSRQGRGRKCRPQPSSRITFRYLPPRGKVKPLSSSPTIADAINFPGRSYTELSKRPLARGSPQDPVAKELRQSRSANVTRGA